jgi:hypothetical protein
MRSISPVPADKIAHDLLKSNERVAELQSISRDASVSQIASRFKGNSVAESRLDFQKKQRKINSEDRLLKLAMFYFQLNKQKSDKKISAAKDNDNGLKVSIVDKTDREQEVGQSPVPVKELKAFWNVNKSSPQSISSNRSPKSNPVSGLTKQQITEVLQSSGISENLVEAEDWIHWENAINSVLEDHVNGKLLISPAPSSDTNDTNSTHQVVLSPRLISPIPFPELTVDPQHFHLDESQNTVVSPGDRTVPLEEPVAELDVDTAAHSPTERLLLGKSSAASEKATQRLRLPDESRTDEVSASVVTPDRIAPESAIENTTTLSSAEWLLTGEPTTSSKETNDVSSVVEPARDTEEVSTVKKHLTTNQVLPSTATEDKKDVTTEEDNWVTLWLYLGLLLFLLLSCGYMFSSDHRQVMLFR